MDTPRVVVGVDTLPASRAALVLALRLAAVLAHAHVPARVVAQP